MIRNPELRRNLWLELSPHRLAAMPGLLGLLFLFTFMTNDNQLGAPTAIAALSAFVAVVLAWGSRLAADSIGDEVAGRTWDTQRMSALTPWQMTWGKLLGANVYTWYGGIICMLVYALAARRADMPVATLPMLGLGIGSAVLMHAAAMLSSLLALRANRRAKFPWGMLLIAFLLFALWPYLHWFRETSDLAWFGLRFQAMYFGLLSVGLFALWAVVAVYRSMSSEMQVRTVPVAWIGFAVFLTLYSSGLLMANGTFLARSGTVPVAIGFCVALVMTYLGACWDRRDIISVRRIGVALRRRDWRNALEEVPIWAASIALALAAALVLLFRRTPMPLPAPAGELIAWTPFTLLLLAVRDIGLLYFFSFGDKPQRAVLTTTVYLLLLYWLLPALLAVAGLAALAILVMPPVLREPAFAALVAGLHLVIVALLLLRRWRSRGVPATRKAPAP
jgi:hypothetical protein